MEYSTADLVDQFGERLQSCEVQFRTYGGHARFNGPVRTLRTWEDNAQVRGLLERPGQGAVLVIDGGASLRTALLGDQLAALGRASGWAGVIILGAVRDVPALGKIPFGIKALGSNPRKSAKGGTGTVDVPVTFGGVTFGPGNWVYCDEDGIVVASERLPA